MRLIFTLVFSASLLVSHIIFAKEVLAQNGVSGSATTFEGSEVSAEERSSRALEEALKRLQAVSAENDALRAQVTNAGVRISANSSESFTSVVERYNQSWIDYYDHEQKLRARARSALSWQLFASTVVLALVVAVTGLGVFLSYREVVASLNAPKDAEENLAALRDVEINTAEEAQSVAKQQTELVLSFQKLQLTSAVTGVIILGLSLGFLFLFLQSAFGLDPQDFAAVAKPNAEQTEIPNGDQ